MNKKSLKKIYAILLVLVLLLTFVPTVTFASNKIEPDASSDSYITTLHIGQSWKWTPYKNYPELSVTYSSDNPDVISIAADGTLTIHKEGFATLKATTPGNDTYDESTFSNSIEVLDASNGLYLYEGDPHFYYQGAKYNSGELPLEIERNLCLTNPDLKVYLTEYLEPAKASIEDNTEATLTAILNYGANYHSKRFLFDGAGGSCEMADTQWTMLLIRHKGLCAPHASLFCYLMYLSNLTSMAVDSGEPKDDRAHTWCIIEHDGYFYNLEEYDFLQKLSEKYATAPLSNSNAEYFGSTICSNTKVPFPTSGSKMTSNIKISDMGRDLTSECPVLLYEHLSDGSYRARFVTVKKGAIPVYADGTLLSMNDVIYKNMETNTYADPSQGEGHAQYNGAAYAVFSVANNLLLKDIAPLWEQDNSSLPSSSNSSNNNDNGKSKKVYPAKTGDKWFIL
ncbi:MAG: hypothetical protein E7279_07535 [Lachnospiraceae bacterium]|nr:hypothetical protein [Lachnospiraceae bacterium]